MAVIVVMNIAAIALSLTRVDFNNAPELYYQADAPAVQLRDRLRKNFPTDEFLIGIFIGPELYSDKTLLALDQVVRRMEKHALVDRVFSVTNVDHIAATEDGFAIEPLIDVSKLADSTPADRRARVMADRFAPGLVAAKDGSALAISIRPKQLKHSGQRNTIEVALHEAVKDAGLKDYLVSVAGPVALDTAQLRSMLADTTALMPITMGISVLLLIWVVGRPAPVIIGAVAMSTVVQSTVGALAALGQPYTLVTAMVPPLLGAYTAATLLHLYASLYRARQAGLRRPRRVIRAVQDIHTASLFNVLTTSAGLASLVLTPIPPIQVFGIVGAVGTLLVYLVVFFLVPPLLVKWDRGPWPKRGGFSWTRKLAFGLAGFAMRRAGWTVGVIAVGLLAAIPLIGKVQVESDLFKYFSESHSVTKSTRVMEERLAGVISLEVVFDGAATDSLKDVDVLKSLKQFQLWADAQPEISRSVSMMDVIEEMNWAFHGEDRSYRQIPDNYKLLSQLLLVYDGKDLYEFVNRDYQSTRIVLSLTVHGAHAIGDVIDRIRDHLAKHPIAGVKSDVGGYGRLFADQSDLLVTGQIQSFFGAFVQIFIILALLWRSASAAAICLIPNLAPLYFIFAVMGVLNISLDMATSLIAGVLLGITVDDTIHLYHSYKHRLEQGVSHTFALARSFEASGRAVLAVTAVLTAQFLLLMGSRFEPTKNFGMLAAIGLIAGQLFELLLLPALLVLRERYRERKALQALQRRQKLRGRR